MKRAQGDAAPDQHLGDQHLGDRRLAKPALARQHLARDAQDGAILCDHHNPGPSHHGRTIAQGARTPARGWF
jgi:hypothetical protein